MAGITFFGIEVFIGFASLSAALSLLIWTYVTARTDPSLPDRSLLYQVTVYLTVFTLMIFDVIIIWGFVWRLERGMFRLMFSFAMGMQLVAGLSATLYVRRYRNRKRRNND